MSWLSCYLKSSVGGKHLVAVTGLLLTLFALQHMIGNLLIYAGQDAFNSYAFGLKHLGHGAVVWLARAGLLGAVLAHLVRGLMLAADNRRARPVRYHKYRPVASSFYQRTMPWTGVFLLLFIAFHLAHFTLGVVDPEAFHNVEVVGGVQRHDAYTMFVMGFQNTPIAVLYIVSMVFLCMHLAHGASSFFQSLGWKHPRYDGLIAKLGPAIGLVLFAGNVSFPVMVMAGVVTLPGGAP